MYFVLNIIIGGSGQFRVLIPSEEERGIEVEITSRIGQSISVLAEHRFIGDIQVIGKIDEVLKSIEKVMKRWAAYFEKYSAWNCRGFRAAQAYTTRRNMRVEFVSSHPASKPSTRPEKKVHLRTQINGTLAVLGEKPRPQGRLSINAIKTLYQTHLYSLLTSKGWGIEIKGKVEDIQKGLVHKTITRLLSLDVRDDQTKRELAELEQKASRSYPSLWIQFFRLHPTPSPQRRAENQLPSPPFAAGSSEELPLYPSPSLTETLLLVEPEVGYLPPEGLLE